MQLDGLGGHEERLGVVSLNSSIGESTGPALTTLADHALCAT